MRGKRQGSLQRPGVSTSRSFVRRSWLWPSRGSRGKSRSQRKSSSKLLSLKTCDSTRQTASTSGACSARILLLPTVLMSSTASAFCTAAFFPRSVMERLRVSGIGLPELRWDFFVFGSDDALLVQKKIGFSPNSSFKTTLVAHHSVHLVSGLSAGVLSLFGRHVLRLPDHRGVMGALDLRFCSSNHGAVGVGREVKTDVFRIGLGVVRTAHCGGTSQSRSASTFGWTSTDCKLRVNGGQRVCYQSIHKLM